MIREWLIKINIGVTAIAFILIGMALYLSKESRPEIEVLREPRKAQELPKSSFLLSEESYKTIGKSTLQLKRAPQSLQLPDLRKVLLYYGKNKRPDSSGDQLNLYFSLAGGKESATIHPGENSYLFYDRNQKPPRYMFSPDNRETSLWFRAVPSDKGATVTVGMKSDKNEVLSEPKAHAVFLLPEKPFLRSSAGVPTIGSFRLDGTLLARQKARWYGLDRFVEKYGGDEYKEWAGKQRIDFGEKTDLYSVYVELGDMLIWDGTKWKVVTSQDQTAPFPLLVVTKVDDRLISFELWDREGKYKTVLNLLKSSEPMPSSNVLQSLKFVGAKTRSQFIFEFNKERVMLSPDDWLLFVDKEARLLKSVEDIDDYVERRLQGFLFVFDSIQKKDDKQVIVGSLFNKSRSAGLNVEILMQQGAVGTVSEPAAEKEKGSAYPTPQLFKSDTPNELRSKSSMQKQFNREQVK